MHGCEWYFVICLYVTILSLLLLISFFFFKQKTAYEMRISDWSSDVCSSDLDEGRVNRGQACVRRDGRFVRTVDEGAGQRRGAGRVVAARGEGRRLGTGITAGERHVARQVGRIEGAFGGGRLELHARRQAAGDHRVVVADQGALVQHHRVVVAGTDEGDVGQVGHRAVGQVLRAHLVHAVAAARALDDQAELDAAAEARVSVEGVVVVAGTNQVLAVDRAAEPFEAVVGAVVHLHVLDRGRSEEHTSELQS